MTILQQQHHNQYRCMHQYTPNSYDSWGELPSISIIHEIPYITIWKQHPCHWSFTKNNPMRDNSQEGKRRTTKPRESSEGRIWRGNQSWLLWVWIIFIFISLSVVHTHTKKKMMRKFLCYASCPGLEVAVSQRMSGNLVLRVLTGRMNMLSLADSFSAQKSQDCIVVGGGNHE